MSSPQIYGATRTTLARQPGSKIIYKLDYSVEGILILEGDASLYTGSNVINIGDAHPDLGGLSCHNVEVERTKLGKIKVVASYIGLNASTATGSTPWFLEATGSLDKESILTHPHFTDTLGGTAASPLNGAIYDATTGDFVNFPSGAANSMQGIDSWYTPHITYRLTQWSYTAPVFQKLGKIITPPISLYAPSNVVNFLQGPMTYRQVGNLYQITNDIWGSGINGWNTLVYS